MRLSSFIKKHESACLSTSVALGFPAVFVSPGLAQETNNMYWFIPFFLIGIPALYVQYKVFCGNANEKEGGNHG